MITQVLSTYAPPNTVEKKEVCSLGGRSLCKKKPGKCLKIEHVCTSYDVRVQRCQVTTAATSFVQLMRRYLQRVWIRRVRRCFMKTLLSMWDHMQAQPRHHSEVIKDAPCHLFFDFDEGDVYKEWSKMKKMLQRNDCIGYTAWVCGIGRESWY